MTVCIQYSRPTSNQNETEVFGLDVAVNNFLLAYFRYSTQDKFICRPSDIPSFDQFKDLAKKAGHDPAKKCIGLDPRRPKENLETIACQFRPDPLIGEMIWQRQQLSGRGYAACGLVHTMSGERIAREVGQLCYAPSDESDALICPSEAIKNAVHNLWDIHADYLEHRFGGKVACPISTPVIPLGTDTKRFADITTSAQRSRQRKALAVDDEDIVVLFLGRLSFATKSHPLPLFLALERAAKVSKKKIRLVMYGYFKPKDMEAHFKNLAKDIVESATVDFIRNDDPRFPDGFWAGADIFISLSDNIQESFGLTPLEAMASGLPSIVSDWDGYRDNVRDGHDGFLIPTLTPTQSSGQAIAEAYFNDQNYGVALMGAAQSTAIDIDRCAEKILALADNDSLRQKMGKKAKERAQSTFDWAVVIRQYEALWDEMEQKRKKSARSLSTLPENWQAVHPSYPNPYFMFDNFPSKILTLHDSIHVVMSSEQIKMLLAHEMNYFLPELLIPKESMHELIEAIRRAGSPSVADILSPFPRHGHDRLWRCLGWMLKHGITIIEPRS